MPLTDEKRAELAALLAEAEPDDLGDYVPKSVLKGRLSEKDKARQSLEADYQGRLSQLQQEHADAMAKLKEHEAKGKTAEQLFAEQLAQAESAAAEAQARAEHLYEQRKADALRQELTALFDASDARPARVQTAIREAMAELNPKIDDINGNFALNPETKDDVGEWWKTRTDLHAAKGSGAPSPGASRAPGDPPPKDPLEGLTPEQQLQYAMRQSTSTRY